MRRKLLVLGLAMAALAGCTTDPAVDRFTGESHANATLKSDTLGTVRLLLRGRGCSGPIEQIESTTLFYEPSNGTAGHLWGREQWVATACGRPFYFQVEFIEDGRGGTFFAVS